MEIKRGNIQTKYHPYKPNAKMIDFYLDQITDSLRQQNSYFFFLFLNSSIFYNILQKV